MPYLPRGYARKSRRRCNGSLSAFVNFTSAEMAVRAVRVFHGMLIQDRRVYVCKAAAQGVAQNLMHFRTVRFCQDLLETAWPYVFQRGKLVETAPTEVIRIMGLGAEIASLRIAANAEASLQDTSSEASSQTQPVTPVWGPMDPAWPVPPFTPMPILPVTDEMVVAYAQLLATMPLPLGGIGNQDDWFTGKLDWTQRPGASSQVAS